jgi:hypothetical protein
MSKNTVKSALTRRRRSRSRKGLRLAVVALRFVIGRPLDGRRYSNGSFWRRGTRRVGYPPYLFTWQWWLLAAGWQRAAVRLAVTAVVTGIALVAWAVVA